MPQHRRPILLCHIAQCDGEELDNVLGHMHAEEGVGAQKANDRQTHGTEQWLYGQMDKWRGEKMKYLSRDAETNGSFYPEALGERSDGSAWDT